MANVHIPAPLRTLTGGEVDLVAEGATLGEVIANLDKRFPGLQARLVEGERLRPGIAVFAESVNIPSRLSTPVSENASLYFAPAISGG